MVRFLTFVRGKRVNETPNDNEFSRSKLRGIKTFCSLLLLAASRGELYPKLD